MADERDLDAEDTDELDPQDRSGTSAGKKQPQLYYCWHCGHQTYESRWHLGWCSSCGSAMPPRKWILEDTTQGD